MRRSRPVAIHAPADMPDRLAGCTPSRAVPEELHLILRADSGTCTLLAARATSVLSSVFRYGTGRAWRAWVIGSGPGAVDTAMLRAGFRRGATLHRLLSRVLRAMHAPGRNTTAFAGELDAAADAVTMFFREHPAIVRSPAQARRHARASRLDTWMTTGDPTDPIHVAARYAAAVAAVTGVQPDVRSVTDLGVLALFAGVPVAPEVSSLRGLAGHANVAPAHGKSAGGGRGAGPGRRGRAASTHANS